MSDRDELADLLHEALGRVCGIYDTTDEEDHEMADILRSKGWGNIDALAAKAEAENRADPAYPYAPTVAGGAARWLRAEATRHKA